MALLLAGVGFAGASPAALAQDAVIEKAALTKIVIAPPRSELARIIKAGLQEAYYGADKDSRAYQQAQKLYFFYGARGFEPLWLTPGVGSAVAFSPNALKIIEVFKAAELEGFRPSDYLTADLDPAAAGTDPTRLAALETAFSQAAVRYAQDAYGGRVAPTAVSKLITIAPKRIDEAQLLLDLAASDAPDQVLLGLDPRHPEFGRLKAALAKFYDGSVTVEQITIPDGKVLKLGMKDERVPLLRTRLAVAAPEIPEGPPTPWWTSPMMRRWSRPSAPSRKASGSPPTASWAPPPWPRSMAAPTFPRTTSSPTWSAGAGSRRISAISTSR